MHVVSSLSGLYYFNGAVQTVANFCATRFPAISTQHELHNAVRILTIHVRMIRGTISQLWLQLYRIFSTLLQGSRERIQPTPFIITDVKKEFLKPEHTESQPELLWIMWSRMLQNLAQPVIAVQPAMNRLNVQIAENIAPLQSTAHMLTLYTSEKMYTEDVVEEPAAPSPVSMPTLETATAIGLLTGTHNYIHVSAPALQKSREPHLIERITFPREQPYHLQKSAPETQIFRRVRLETSPVLTATAVTRMLTGAVSSVQTPRALIQEDIVPTQYITLESSGHVPTRKKAIRSLTPAHPMSTNLYAFALLTGGVPLYSYHLQSGEKLKDYGLMQRTISKLSVSERKPVQVIPVIEKEVVQNGLWNAVNLPRNDVPCFDETMDSTSPEEERIVSSRRAISEPHPVVSSLYAIRLLMGTEGIPPALRGDEMKILASAERTLFRFEGLRADSYLSYSHPIAAELTGTYTQVGSLPAAETEKGLIIQQLKESSQELPKDRATGIAIEQMQVQAGKKIVASLQEDRAVSEIHLEEIPSPLRTTLAATRLLFGIATPRREKTLSVTSPFSARATLLSPEPLETRLPYRTVLQTPILHPEKSELHMEQIQPQPAMKSSEIVGSRGDMTEHELMHPLPVSLAATMLLISPVLMDTETLRRIPEMSIEQNEMFFQFPEHLPGYAEEHAPPYLHPLQTNISALTLLIRSIAFEQIPSPDRKDTGTVSTSEKAVPPPVMCFQAQSSPVLPRILPRIDIYAHAGELWSMKIPVTAEESLSRPMPPDRAEGSGHIFMPAPSSIITQYSIPTIMEVRPEFSTIIEQVKSLLRQKERELDEKFQSLVTEREEKTHEPKPLPAEPEPLLDERQFEEYLKRLIEREAKRYGIVFR